MSFKLSLYKVLRRGVIFLSVPEVCRAFKGSRAGGGNTVLEDEVGTEINHDQSNHLVSCRFTAKSLHSMT